MERLSESGRASALISDNARKARWAEANAQQASTTTASGGLELQMLWPNALSCSAAAAPQVAPA